MSETPLHNIRGIGPKTEEKLKKIGVLSVESLAKVDDKQFANIGNLKSLKLRAKQFLHSLSVTQPNGVERKQVSQAVALEFEYCIESHSWWELSLFVPCEENGQYALKKAIVYELSITSNNRIALVCSFVSSHLPAKVLTNSYSPQILFMLNPQIKFPTLTITVPKKFWADLNNQHVILSTLWEMNILVNETERFSC